MHATPMSSSDENAIRALYRELLRCWNGQDARTFASLFVEDGTIILFDGTLVSGQAAIETRFGAIFQYDTPAYVTKTLSVRFLSDEVAALYGIVGMYSLPEGRINPTLNAIQTLVASRRDGVWRIEHFQNTRAQFPDRPEDMLRMTEELQREADRL